MKNSKGLTLRLKNPELKIEGYDSLKLSDEAVRILYNRGYRDAESILNFMLFKPYQLREVSTMKDYDAFMVELLDAVKNDRKITIYGDYDGDGVMATIIWYMGLTEIGHKPHWFVNNRFSEGYGMNAKGVKRLLEMYPDTELIVTCDNGIKAIEGVQYAQSQGVKVIVSDHHTQTTGEELPPCPVVCEKRLDESEDGEWFCGAELSRRLVNALYEKLGCEDKHHKFLDKLYAYSGFATVTDSITMNAANHYVVKEGIRQITREDDIFWTIFREETTPRGKFKKIDQDTIGFTYGPMVNADGRVTGSVDLVMRALMDSYWYGKTLPESKDFLLNLGYTEERVASMHDQLLEDCRKTIVELRSVNERRKAMSANGDEKAVKAVKENGWTSSKFIVLADDSFEEGINGLIASHITEQFHVPSLVLCPKDGEPDVYKGSARSVDDFNVIKALEQCKDLLLGFGGHAGAAGVSIKKENIPLLRKALEEAAQNAVADAEDIVDVDFILTPKTMSPRLNDELNQLAPFGEGFPKPSIGFEGEVKEVMIMKDVHVKFSLESQRNPIEILWWNSIQQYRAIKERNKGGTHLVCTGSIPAYTIFRGKPTTQIFADNVDII